LVTIASDSIHNDKRGDIMNTVYPLNDEKGNYCWRNVSGKMIKIYQHLGLSVKSSVYLGFHTLLEPMDIEKSNL